ncbi:hypothetical protein [Flagellimonas meishanensis]|uniref:hypothetical protein n=1 Tax=Flagellimonas meishanensis TaxID=2873264 RepID=UPI001CA65082|nr:hypothetical protein [[Muricauda] meishanensis]
MQHLQLTRKEIDKLTEIKDSVQKLVNYVEKQITDFEISENHELFIQRRTEYEQRWKKYKNKIFHILNDSDWNESLPEWIDKICIEKEVNRHHYLDISALNVFLHNLLAFQYPLQTEPTTRMVNAILTEQGYEDGILTITELYEEETNETIKSELGKRVKRSKEFSKYKEQLIDIALSDNKSIWEWTNSNNLTSQESYDILCEFSLSLEFMDKTKGNLKVEDELDNALDDLWNIKLKNNSG